MTDARAYNHAHRREILASFINLLKIPNIANDRANIARNVDAISVLMRREGLEPKILHSPEAPDAPPLILGEWKFTNARRTIVLYAHYDGQPVNPSQWTTSPWSAKLRAGGLDSAVVPPEAPAAIEPETRVYARGAGDDKGGVMVILNAINALRAQHLPPTDNIKVVFEGEEEAGSPHLGEILRAHKDVLGGQLWVICDGPAHATGRPLITYGVRGDMNVDLTVYGPNRPLHSGHYGNWAPNPALRLARLLSSMKDDANRVVVAGWYDDVKPMGPLEKAAIAASAKYDDALRRELGLASTDTNQPLAAAVTEPSLNINGMRSADVAQEAANVIPSTAAAVLDIRLVAGQTPQRQYDKLVAHVRAQGYHVLDHTPSSEERLAYPLIATMGLRPGAYAASRVPMDEPLAHSLAEAARKASPEGIVELPTSGGSLPLSIITDTLGATAFTVSIANHDDNQHAANENLRLGNLWSGIDLYTALLLHR